MNGITLIRDCTIGTVGITKELAKVAVDRANVVYQRLDMDHAPEELKDTELLDLEALAALGKVRSPRPCRPPHSHRPTEASPRCRPSDGSRSRRNALCRPSGPKAARRTIRTR
jgi:hypothetical protein